MEQGALKNTTRGFELVAPYKPTGDQPEAIRQLVAGIEKGDPSQTLLGVTGSGKTFTMANVLAELNRPTLVLSHNKTLAAQLYGEFKQFFPHNAVEYFISYYDYYQPEAYIPSTGLYIEKDLSINEEIEKMRLSTTSALMSKRRDVLVVASVSCIYGLGNPAEYEKNTLHLAVGMSLTLRTLLFSLVEILYRRTESEFKRGTFRVRGDTLDVFPAYMDTAYRIRLWGDEIEVIQRIDPYTGERIDEQQELHVFPANLFVADRQRFQKILRAIQDDMVEQVEVFMREGRALEAKRLQERTEHDLEMMRELGYCSGVENYSRYFDGRQPRERPYCLLDYFPEDYLMFIDESHVTIPQVRGMWGGDRSRKVNLVEYGFRLSAALDNRPLSFHEFETMVHQVIHVSATPGGYELTQSGGVIVEQIIRPTGLLDPEVGVRESRHQMDNILKELRLNIAEKERTLITTLTKRMAEELTDFLVTMGVKCRYIHSDVTVLDRVDILRSLRMGAFDVLVGVNLLREGLDLPEVSLVVILDADKEGYLRNERSLIQTIGRAARHVRGRVLMYADKTTVSMQEALSETARRRRLQMAYNEKHQQVPKGVSKSKDEVLGQTKIADSKKRITANKARTVQHALEQDPVLESMSTQQLSKLAKYAYEKMKQASERLDFVSAARFRDEWQALEVMREKS